MCKLHYIEHEISSDHRAVYNAEPRQIKYIFQSNRKLTDRYWIVLFVVVFIIWMASWHCLLCRSEFFKNNSISSVQSKSPSDLIHNTTDYASNMIITHKTFEFVSIPGIFHIFTCNIIFLNTYYETSGSIIAWANALFCSCLILYSFISMRSDNIFCKQIVHFGECFIMFLVGYRLSMFFFIDNELVKIHYNEKIAFWVIPEIIFIITLATRKSPKADDQDTLKLKFKYLSNYTCTIGIFMVGFLCILIMVTIISVCHLAWDDPLYYVITGSTWYLSLTLFYFISMVMSCGTSIVLHSPVRIPMDTLFLRALCIIGWYNFGTACYHATLVFPRLHTLFLMNKTEFNTAPNFSFAQRFYIAQCKFHNVSPTFTAVLGDNHSESMKELIRLSISNYPTLKHFQGFTEICSSVSLILIPVNSMLLTLLWSQEAIVDPCFPTGTWTMIFIPLFITYMHMRVFDAISDTLWLHEDDENMWDFSAFW